jgi:vancomycin resistance protein VanW
MAILPGQTRSLVDESRTALAWRKTKVALLQGRRLVDWALWPERYAAPQLAESGERFSHLHGARQVSIARNDPNAHPVFEEGKRINVALAAPAFDGLLLAPGQPLSFWRTLGRVTEEKGFRHGMELRGGCITPSLGGGLCLISNALFALAAELGWTILERHGHSLEAVPPPSGQVWGLDATAFWPYVDLRVVPVEGPVRLNMKVHGEHLRISVHGEQPLKTHSSLRSVDEHTERVDGELVRSNRVVRERFDKSGRSLGTEIVAENRTRILTEQHQHRNCLTCGEESCHARVQIRVASLTP